ncbi:hypothetical protein MSAN_02062700 [Mycena sanguinolenta]|uniref:Uncharacterized protein n=1 Tax=Mycena sanguinolenta TaxID=230812 RepID=A0A8H7CL16_9AGAR|nr:hypothetical protein MSAN_02062700 [Mycena sanguinolenta]
MKMGKHITCVDKSSDLMLIMDRGRKNSEGIGGKGGIGHGLKFGEPMVSIRDGAQVQGLDESMDEFCRRYCLGEEISNRLRQNGFVSPGSFQYVTDLELHTDGFKVGHIAEIKWALRKMVGKDLLARSGKPELRGDIGGKGGHGGRKGGEGGVGDAAVVPVTYLYRFAKIWGGIGGQGGTTDQDLQRPPSLVPERVTLWERLRSMLGMLSSKIIETERPHIYGGVGGKGGDGTHRGGEGGVGEASQIPIGMVSIFAKIFGGIGGEGGAGGSFGGRGGIGRGSVFSEFLGCAHERTLNAPPTLLADYAMAEELREMLLHQGFVTVGALFMVTGEDLVKVGFKTGHIATLKRILRLHSLIHNSQAKLQNVNEGESFLRLIDIELIQCIGRNISGGGRGSGGSGGEGRQIGRPQIEMDTHVKVHVSGSIGGDDGSEDNEAAVGGEFGEDPVVRSGTCNVNGQSPSEDKLNSASARIDVNQLAGEGGDFKQRSYNAAEAVIAGKGGFGEGPRIRTALVDRSTLEGITLPEMSMTRFFNTYSLGEELRKIVLDTGYENAADLLFAEDLSVEKFGFKIGQVAELSWALVHMLLQSGTVNAVDLIREGDYRPHLIGGIGGSGGSGRKGGMGGDGMGPRVALTDVHRFRSIGGGIGGPGGSSGTDSNGHGQGPVAEEQLRVPVDPADLPGTLYGGRGGAGASHPKLGSIGGGGGGPVLSIKAVGHFQHIQGGQGGPGGNSNNQGGQGGTGYAPEFSELLCTIDTETRLQVSNLKLKETAELKAARFNISDTLNGLLQQCGFETVCGLFHVQENDLPDSIFKIGHKMTLKRALTEFRRNIAPQSRPQA